MNRKFFGTILMAYVLAILSAIPIMADENAVKISFTPDNKFVYTSGSYDSATGTYDMGPAFEGMAPGEARSQSLTVTNDNAHTVTFYVDVNALSYLEAGSKASGAFYDVKLTSDVDGSISSIYDSDLGGAQSRADGTAVKNDKGLSEINDSAVNNMTYFATLKPGQSAELTLSLALEGESMRNVYALKNGTLAFDLSAMYDTPEQKVIVKKIKETGESKKVTETVAGTGSSVKGKRTKTGVLGVRTGDESLIVVFAGLLIGALTVLVITGIGKRKRKDV